MKKPNLVVLGIDSLRRDRMSLHGYHRLTTPHIDAYAAGGAVMEQAFSPSVPTTSGYASMFTGMDCFGTDVVALRHKGPMGNHVATLAEVLGGQRVQVYLCRVQGESCLPGLLKVPGIRRLGCFRRWSGAKSRTY